jgi:cation:H+ antiporter
MFGPLLPLIAGLAMLVLGAEALVRGAARLAAVFGVSSLVVGLTVVAFGTSAPELSVSLLAALRGVPGLAVGNAVGSNSFNILVILGLAALVTPLAVQRRLVRQELPLLIAVTLLLLAFGLDGRLSRGEGALLLLLLLLYLALLGRQLRGERSPAPVTPRAARPLLVDCARILVGLALLVLGAQRLVDGATAFALQLGASPRVIGLTVVAAGTSLPELAASLVAALRHERDIAVGNVLGSNLFNLLGVLGGATLAAPAGLPLTGRAQGLDLAVSLLAALACLPIFITGGRISRLEGALMLLGYGAYLALLMTRASA